MIGGYGRTCSEVYDSVSRKFTMFSLKLPCHTDRYIQCKTLSFNNKTVVFCECSDYSSSKSFVYNVYQKRWELKEMLIVENFRRTDTKKVKK